MPPVRPVLLMLALLAITCVFADGDDGPVAVPAETPRHMRLSVTALPTEMLVVWHTAAMTAKSLVQYSCMQATSRIGLTLEQLGTASTYDGAQVFVHRVVLTGLTPNCVYRYRVGDGVTWSQANTFKTRAGAGSEIKVSLFADQGIWGGAVDFQKILLGDLRTELAFHLGDLSYAQTEERWNEWFDLVAPVQASLPYMVIPGNWDVMEHSRALFSHRFHHPLLAAARPAFAALSSEAQLAAPVVPGQNLYYAFDYGPVHFVMMNSYEPYNDTSAQGRWLRADLAAASAPARRAAVPFIVVNFHSPMYSSSDGHSGGDRAFQDAVEQLLIDHHVDLCLTGHDHGYERTFPVDHGVVMSTEKTEYSADNKKHPIHMLVGIGGATQDPWRPAEQWSVMRENMIGVVSLYAQPSPPCLTVVVSRLNGSTADKFAICRGRGVDIRTQATAAQAMMVFFVVISLLTVIFFWPTIRTRFCVGKHSPCHSSPKSSCSV